jgi:hypothetical protein
MTIVFTSSTGVSGRFYLLNGSAKDFPLVFVGAGSVVLYGNLTRSPFKDDPGMLAMLSASANQDSHTPFLVAYCSSTLLKIHFLIYLEKVMRHS